MMKIIINKYIINEELAKSQISLWTDSYFFEGVLYRVWHNFHLKKIPALQKLLKKSCKGSHVKDRHPCFITKIPDFC